MSISISFENNGKVQIFRYENGDTFSVTTDANKLQAVMPGPYFDELRSRLAAVLELTGNPIKRINR